MHIVLKLPVSHIVGQTLFHISIELNIYPGSINNVDTVFIYLNFYALNMLKCWPNI